MNRPHLLSAATLALAALCTTPAAFADSSTSSASSAGSASSGSVSDSIGGSSDASSPDKEKVAQGEYRVVNVAAAPDRPGKVRLTLQGTEPTATREFVLFVPEQALATRPVAAGDHVFTHVRPYGFEFAHADTRQAFFLALKDDWQQDLGMRVVQL